MTELETLMILYFLGASLLTAIYFICRYAFKINPDSYEDWESPLNQAKANAKILKDELVQDGKEVKA